MRENLRKTTRQKRGVPAAAYEASAVLAPEWESFRDRLGAVLAQLEDGQFLIVSLREGHRFVQFAAQGDAGMRVEVTSNHYLEGAARLTRSQMAWLRAHGWHPPTGNPVRATPDKDPDGSPNYFIDAPVPVAAEGVAWIAVETLAGALEAPSPSSLTYEAFTAEGEMLVFEGLGLKPLDRARREVMAQVLEVFREVTQISDLELDDEGDVSLLYGSVPVYALHLDGKVRLVSVLARGVRESLALLRKLNQMNDGPVTIRCVLREGTVFGLADLPCTPFVPAHLAEAAPNFCTATERLAAVLETEFGSGSVGSAMSRMTH